MPRGQALYLKYIYGTIFVLNVLRLNLIFWLNYPSMRSCLDHRVPDEILEVPGPKMFWMPWRMTQKQIFRKTSVAKCNFRKNGGRGMTTLATLRRDQRFYFSPLIFYYIFFVQLIGIKGISFPLLNIILF